MSFPSSKLKVKRKDFRKRVQGQIINHKNLSEKMDDNKKFEMVWHFQWKYI